MTADELAARLDARPTASGWMARCPAHEDHTPSLSIKGGADGRVLLLPLNHRALWRLTVLFLLVVLVVWRPDVLWTLFFAPGVAALGLMAFLPTLIADRIIYRIDPEGGAASAIPLVAVVSIAFWAGLMLVWWTYRRRKQANLSSLR